VATAWLLACVRRHAELVTRGCHVCPKCRSTFHTILTLRWRHARAACSGKSISDHPFLVTGCTCTADCVVSYEWLPVGFVSMSIVMHTLK
jgi:hypothetical protein